MKYEQVLYTPAIKKILEYVFTDEFMTQYTNFDDFKSFQYSSAVFVNWNADVLVYDIGNLDDFVKGSTQFCSWDEMVHAGMDTHIKK